MLKLLLFLVVISISTITPQSKDSLYSLNLEVGAGYSYHLTDLNMPDVNLHGFNGTLRIMWQPEHLLRIGLETGYHQLYSLDKVINLTGIGRSEAEISMFSIPLLTVFSMVVFPQMLPELEIKLSSGVMFLNTRGNGFGSKASSSQITLGFSGAATYLRPLNEHFAVGAELKYYNFAKIDDGNLSLQFIFTYKFMRY